MLQEKDYEVIRWLSRLDQHAIAKEAIWGVGFLQENCTSDFKAKWDRQQKKLTDAVGKKNIPLIGELVEGTIRAWDALEKNVRGQGIEPQEPECMDVKLESGFHLRIAKNHTEARSVTEDGVYVWSLHEIARVIESEYTLLNKIKSEFKGAEIKVIDKIEDDEVPEF